MLGLTEISNREDIIDSRSIIERIDHLEIDEPELDTEDTAELTLLRRLVEELRGYAGDRLEDGIDLIRDSYFQEYAEDLADDIGAIDRNAKWPLDHLDWEAAAASLKMDYTFVEFDGITYWHH